MLSEGYAQTFPNMLSKTGPKAISAPVSVIGRSRRPGGYLVGREVLQAPDFTSMTVRRPHDRGFVTAFDTQRDVWASVFSEDRGLGVTADVRREAALVLTEAIGVPLRVRRGTDQLVYETFAFDSCAVAPAARLAAGVLLDDTHGGGNGVNDTGGAGHSSSLAQSRASNKTSSAPGAGSGFGGRRYARGEKAKGRTSRRGNKNTRISGPRTLMVVDTGFSASVATPIVNGREVAHACKRLSLGGKALTNLLKHTVSYRSWNMADETMVMTAVKERCCYVAPFAHGRAAASYSAYIRTGVSDVGYLLPDATAAAAAAAMTNSSGGGDGGRGGGVQAGLYMNAEERERDERRRRLFSEAALGRVLSDVDYDVIDPAHDQVLPLRNERVAVPEALFHPGDIGVPQGGVHELVLQAVETCHSWLRTRMRRRDDDDDNDEEENEEEDEEDEDQDADDDVRPDLFANVVLTGGNCKFDGFYQRFVDQLRPLVPADYDIAVHMDSVHDPALTPLKGALRLLTLPDPPLDFVSRRDYMESGTDAILRQLHGDLDDVR